MPSAPRGRPSPRPKDGCCWKRRGESPVTTNLGQDAPGRQHVATAPLVELFETLGTSVRGLSTGEAAARLARVGPNSVRSHRLSAAAVLRRQLNNAVLGLLAVTAVLSFFLG